MSTIPVLHPLNTTPSGLRAAVQESPGTFDVSGNIVHAVKEFFTSPQFHELVSNQFKNANDKLLSLTRALRNLSIHTSAPTNRAQLISSLREAIGSLESLIGKNSPESRSGEETARILALLRSIFEITPTPTTVAKITPPQTQSLLAHLDELLSDMRIYQKMIDKSIPRDQSIDATIAGVRSRREMIARHLLGASPGNRNQLSYESPEKGSLRAFCESYLTAQQGGFSAAIRAGIENATDTGIHATGRAKEFANGFFNASQKLSDPPLEELDVIDQPRREVRPDGEIIDHALVEEAENGNWLSELIDYFKGEKDPSQNKIKFRILHASLSYLKKQVQKEYNSDGRNQRESLENDPILSHIDQALTLIDRERLNPNGTLETNEEVIDQVRNLMGQHPIWLSKFIEINPLEKNTSDSSAEARIRSQHVRHRQNATPLLDDDEDDPEALKPLLPLFRGMVHSDVSKRLSVEQAMTFLREYVLTE